MRRSGVLVGAGLLACVAAIAMASAPACTIAGVCEGSESSYCGMTNGVVDPNCTAHFSDPYTWESTPIGGTWLPYAGERQWDLFMNDPSGAHIQGRPSYMDVYVSATNRPESFFGSFVEASGNLALEQIWCLPGDPNCMAGDAIDPDLHSIRVDVKNDTCQLYYMRAVVHFEPLDGGAMDGSVDGAADGADSAGGD